MKKFICLFLLSISIAPGSVIAQYSMQDVISTANQNAFNEKLDYLKTHKLRLPFLEQVTVRLNSEILDYMPHSYALRFRNNSIAAIVAQRKMLKPTMQIEESENTIVYHEELKLRYEGLVEYYFTHIKEKQLDTLKQLIEDKKALVYKQIELGINNKIEDIIEIEEDNQKIQSELEENQLKKIEWSKTMKYWLKDSSASPNIDFSNIISIDKIRAHTRLGSTADLVENPSILKRRGQIEVNAIKEQVIRRSHYNILNFWQISYQDSLKKNDLFDTRIAFGVGLNIPFPNSDRLKIQNAHLDRLDAERKYQLEKDKFETEIELSLIKLNTLIQNHTAFKKQMDEFNAKFSAKTMKEKGNTDPLLLLKLKLIETRKSIALAELEYKLMKSYVQWLSKQYKLDEKNYLIN
ncbi:MAG: TolC family protein [Bacteroidetes bacterium]|nr:TolC family protein [Bacteroidota bacterium]